MPDSGISDGSVYTSSFHDTYVRQQVVAQVTSGTRPTGVEGRLITESDSDRLMAYSGSAWVRVGNYSSSGRTGFNLSRVALQSISGGATTFTAISFDTELTDTDGFIAVTADTITVPAGLGGIYAITGTVGWATAPGTNSSIEIYNVTTGNIYRQAVGGASQMTSCAVSVIIALSTSDQIQLRVSHGGGSAINVTSLLQGWMMSP
jgi:hypothetical protein